MDKNSIITNMKNDKTNQKSEDENEEENFVINKVDDHFNKTDLDRIMGKEAPEITVTDSSYENKDMDLDIFGLPLKLTYKSPGGHLLPPPLEKQFLISPPCSPPVGWAPAPESTPLINFELLAAISKLAPGEPLILHEGSTDQPDIIVHICENDEKTS